MSTFLVLLLASFLAPPPAVSQSNDALVSKVNVVTGEYVDQACDLVVAGCEPLSLRRFYGHLSHHDQVYGGWRVNPECLMLYNFELSKIRYEYTRLVGIGERSGSFRVLEDVGSGVVGYDRERLDTGQQGSGQTHPYNYQVSFERINGKECKFAYRGDVIDGSGRVRHFETDMRLRPTDKYHTHFTTESHYHRVPPFGPFPPYQAYITEERLANGNVIVYEYDDYNLLANGGYPADAPEYYILRKITAYNADKSVELGWIAFEYKSAHWAAKGGSYRVEKVIVTGSDGRKVVWHNDRRDPKTLLDEQEIVMTGVEAPGKPCQSFKYKRPKTKKRKTMPFLRTMSLPGGQTLEIGYHRTDKVRYLRAPEEQELWFAYREDSTLVTDLEGGKTIYYHDGDQRITAIQAYDGDELVSVERNYWERSTGNLLEKRMEDGRGIVLYAVQYAYDKNQNCIEERVGDSVVYQTFSDDGRNLLLERIESSGKRTTYEYVSGKNLLALKCVWDGDDVVRRESREYDAKLTSVCVRHVVEGAGYCKIVECRPRRSMPCLGLAEEVCEKTLDETGQEVQLKRVVYTYHPSGKVESEAHYDANNALRYTLTNVYDEHERLMASTDACGHTTSYAYDDNFNRIEVKTPTRTERMTYDAADRQVACDVEGLVSEKRYDRAGRVVCEIDPFGHETAYVYDGLGRKQEIHHPAGGVTKYVYCPLGHAIKSITPDHYETLTGYNWRGQPLQIFHPDGSQEAYVYDAHGRQIVHTDRNGQRWHTSYDIFDRVVKTEGGEKITQATYTPFCQLSETDALGVTTFYAYDQVGRKIEERKGERVVRHGYDALGRQNRIERGSCVQEFTYDLADRVIEKRGDHTFAKYAYDAAGNCVHDESYKGVTRTTYNEHDQPTKIVTPAGAVTHFKYDYSGPLTKTTINPLGVETTEVFGAENRLEEVVIKDQEGAVCHRRTFAYDAMGQKRGVDEHVYRGNAFDRVVSTSWEYGPMGNVTRMVEGGRKTTSYVYDACGRLQVKELPSGIQLRHSYDPYGRLVRFYTDDGHIDHRYAYDLADRVVEVLSQEGVTRRTYNMFGNLVEEKLANGYVLKSTFDADGMRASLTYPDETTAEFTYSGGRIKTIAYNGREIEYFARAPNGQPTLITTPEGAIHFSYDPVHRPTLVTSPHFTAHNISYDHGGNLTSYTYNDPLGEVEESYTYDPLNQLTSETAHTYTYDSLGNRIQKDAYSHRVNDLNQVVSDGQSTYRYDTDGNCTSVGDSSLYTYDPLGRLITAFVDGKEVRYTYDPFNRRLSKTVGSTTQRYIWDKNSEIGSSAGELRILGEGLGGEIGAAVLIKLGRRTYVPFHNHRGDLVALVGRRGETYRYTAFGEELTGHTKSPWRFSSKRVDPETGYSYFGQRYYNPALGRWITPDPEGFDDGPNLYAYLKNGPLTAIDPYGLYAKTFDEVDGVGSFMSWCTHKAFSAIEWAGANLLPLPSSINLIEATGRWAAGGKFFDKSNYHYSHGIFSIKGREAQGQHLTYHNGIMTTPDSALAHGEEVSRTHGDAAVTVLYRASYGLVGDLLGCAFGKLGFITPYDIMCANYYRVQLRENPNLTITATSHSRSGIHMKNMGNMLSDRERQHIHLRTFGSATLIPNDFFGSAVNYISPWDPVPMTNPLAILAGIFSVGYNVQYVTPATNCPFKEHGFLEQTYSRELRRLGRDFVDRYFNE